VAGPWWTGACSRRRWSRSTSAVRTSLGRVAVLSPGSVAENECAVVGCVVLESWVVSMCGVAGPGALTCGREAHPACHCQYRGVRKAETITWNCYFRRPVSLRRPSKDMTIDALYWRYDHYTSTTSSVLSRSIYCLVMMYLIADVPLLCSLHTIEARLAEAEFFHALHERSALDKMSCSCPTQFTMLSCGSFVRSSNCPRGTTWPVRAMLCPASLPKGLGRVWTPP
jgi:hypothetical protein